MPKNAFYGRNNEKKNLDHQGISHQKVFDGKYKDLLKNLLKSLRNLKIEPPGLQVYCIRTVLYIIY